MVPTLQVADLAAALKTGQPPVLLDVREPWELEIASLPGAVAIPLRQVPVRAVQELNPSDKIVVFCHHGGRSAQATQWLLQNGFTEVLNLAGGIDAWASEVDVTVPRY